jgi:SHS2 domain-containing protein
VSASRPWETFHHGADIGVRGFGATRAAAFEAAALAVTGVITEPAGVRELERVEMRFTAADEELLFYAWINALVTEMAVRRMLFGRFEVSIEGAELNGSAWGESVDVERHAPAVEVKGATLTELRVERLADGRWVAQCVVDV